MTGGAAYYRRAAFSFSETMQPTTLLLILLVLSFAAYQVGMRRSVALVRGKVHNLHSLPSYYGYYTALWCSLPALLLFVLWLAFQDTIIVQLVTHDLPIFMDAAGVKSMVDFVLLDESAVPDTVQDVGADVAGPFTQRVVQRRLFQVTRFLRDGGVLGPSLTFADVVGANVTCGRCRGDRS